MQLNECEQLKLAMDLAQDRRSKIQDRILQLPFGDMSKKLSKARALYLSMKELLSQVTELVEEYLFVIKGKSSEGKDIVIDLRQERRESEEFLREHNLLLLADALPKRFLLSSRVINRCYEVIGMGFDRVMFMPGAVEQERVPITTFKRQLADTPLPGLEKGEQYTESELGDPLSTECTMVEDAKTQRRGAYLLFYSSACSIPQAMKKLTFRATEGILNQKGLTSLTLQEFYLLERKECQKNKNHKWAVFTWCLSSHVLRAPDCFIGAHWFSYVIKGKISIASHCSDDVDSTLGVRPVVVVPLG